MNDEFQQASRAELPGWVLRQKLTALWLQLQISHHELADVLHDVLADTDLWLPLLTQVVEV